VFLKADTRRLGASLRWDPATRRLHIRPDERLDLRRTYTVELSPALRFADGETLGETYFWQFTTNSLRRPQSPLPSDGRVDLSPFVALVWDGLTESSAGPVTYEIHAGEDSTTVADPGGPALTAVAAPPFVPRVRWRQDGPIWWAVHALNTVTGERLVGPAWRFTPFPADAAFDSVAVPVADWNWIESNNPLRQRCTEDSLVMAPNIVSSIRWNLGPVDTSVRLTGAAIELTSRRTNVPAVTGPSVWSATAAFAGCEHAYPGPPWADIAAGPLADAEIVGTYRIRFSSDALTAHFEATRRLGGLYGYLFRSPFRRSYYGPGAGDPSVRAVLKFYVYRPPDAPVLRASGAALAGDRRGR